MNHTILLFAIIIATSYLTQAIPTIQDDYEHAGAKKQYDYESVLAQNIAREQDDDYPQLKNLLKDVLAKEQNDYAREQDDDYPELEDLLKNVLAKEQDDGDYEDARAKKQDDYESVLAQSLARKQDDDYPELQGEDYENAQAKEQGDQQMSMLQDVLQGLAKSESDATTQGRHCYYFSRSSARRLYNLLRRAYNYSRGRRG